MDPLDGRLYSDDSGSEDSDEPVSDVEDEDAHDLPRPPETPSDPADSSEPLTSSEIRSFRETETLYRSQFLRLSFTEILRQVRPSKSQQSAIDGFLRQVHTCLSQSVAGEDSADALRVHIIGSHLLRSSCVSTRRFTPRPHFHSDSVENDNFTPHSYSVDLGVLRIPGRNRKLTFELLEKKLRSENSFRDTGMVFHLAFPYVGDFRKTKPVLECWSRVLYVEHGRHRHGQRGQVGVKMRFFFEEEEGEPSPNRNRNRSVSLSVREDQLCMAYLKKFHSLMSLSSRIVEALMLVKVWSSRIRILDHVSGFVWTALLWEFLNEDDAMVSSNASTYQILLGFWNWLGSIDAFGGWKRRQHGRGSRRRKRESDAWLSNMGKRIVLGRTERRRVGASTKEKKIVCIRVGEDLNIFWRYGEDGVAATFALLEPIRQAASVAASLISRVRTQQVEVIEALFLRKCDPRELYDMIFALSFPSSLLLPSRQAQAQPQPRTNDDDGDATMSEEGVVRPVLKPTVLNILRLLRVSLDHRIEFLRVLSLDNATANAGGEEGDERRIGFSVGISVASDENALPVGFVRGPIISETEWDPTGETDPPAVAEFKFLWGEEFVLQSTEENEVVRCVTRNFELDYDEIDGCGSPRDLELEHIVSHVVSRHFGESSDVWMLGGDLPIPPVASSDINSLNSAFRELSSALKECDVTIRISDVASVSQSLRGTHCCPIPRNEHVMRVVPGGMDTMDMMRDDDDVDLGSEPPSNTIAPVPHPVIVTLPRSRRWPTRPDAISKLKELILIRFHRHLRFPSVVNREYLDVLHSAGVVFRVSLMVEDEDQSLPFFRSVVVQPLHDRWIRGFATRHGDAFLQTARLLQLWSSRHLFSDQVRPEIWELLAAHAFSCISPFRAPRRVLPAFHRVLKFLSRLDRHRFLFVDLAGEFERLREFNWNEDGSTAGKGGEGLTEEEKSQLVTLLSAEEDRLRQAERDGADLSFTIVPLYCTERLDLWTIQSQMTVRRLQQLARVAVDVLESCYEESLVDPEDAPWDDLLKTSFDSFDILLDLTPRHPVERDIESEGELLESFAIGLDVFHRAVAKLRRELQGIAAVFWNEYGDRLDDQGVPRHAVGIVWNPDFFLPRTARNVGDLSFMIPLPSEPGVPTLFVPNIVELKDFLIRCCATEMVDIANIGFNKSDADFVIPKSRKRKRRD